MKLKLNNTKDAEMNSHQYLIIFDDKIFLKSI